MNVRKVIHGKQNLQSKIVNPGVRNEGNGVFTIESKNTNTTITGFETFDNTGKLIQSQKTSATTVGVDLSMLANGIYFLRINTDIGLQTFKVVK